MDKRLCAQRLKATCLSKLLVFHLQPLLLFSAKLHCWPHTEGRPRITDGRPGLQMAGHASIWCKALFLCSENSSSKGDKYLQKWTVGGLPPRTVFIAIEETRKIARACVSRVPRNNHSGAYFIHPEVKPAQGRISRVLRNNHLGAYFIRPEVKPAQGRVSRVLRNNHSGVYFICPEAKPVQGRVSRVLRNNHSGAYFVRPERFSSISAKQIGDSSEPFQSYSRTREVDSEELLEQLPALQQLLYDLIGCWVLKESLKIYCAINDGVINLVDKLREAPRMVSSPRETLANSVFPLFLILILYCYLVIALAHVILSGQELEDNDDISAISELLKRLLVKDLDNLKYLSCLDLMPQGLTSSNDGTLVLLATPEAATSVAYVLRSSNGNALSNMGFQFRPSIGNGIRCKRCKIYDESYDELLKEASLASTKGFGEIYGANCSMTHEDLIVFHNNANKPTASNRPATPESNNLPIGRPSSGLAFIKPKGYSASKDIQFIESSVLVRGKTPTAAITKADMEQLAQNRGNAMQHYKEKKKYRRYDKHIRYELKKARADTRKRVKGRFVKASEAPDG
ncbi:hypothetical protein HYC85_031039 [Camellia sinensis]|uniref:CCT domain-containing protein n=1 Tax=Camellia sinensis TaxID=4442 RepID=A0A7J7FT38_CAMSI|nr:hypothetical protein HYC85_031039 [Camellia sinensis]